MLSRKKLGVVLTVIIGLVIVFLLFFLYLDHISSNETDELNKIGRKANTEAVDRTLEQLKNPLISTKEKYKALLKIVFYFNAKYYRTHDPSVREYVMEDLSDFAKKKFPKEYNADDFNTPCSDPKCGQDLDAELIEALSMLEKANVPRPIKNTIAVNIKTAGYASEKDRNDRIFGIELAIDQLKDEGDKIASDAASLLLKYLTENYDYESK